MDWNTPGFSVLQHLPERAQTHVHWFGDAIHHRVDDAIHHRVDDAIQPSHPMLSPFPPAFNLPQHQGLFQCVSSSHYGQNIGASTLASVLPMNIQGWFHLGWTGCISLQSKELWRVFSNTIVQKHQFFTAQLSLWSNSHPYMATGEEIALTIWMLVSKVMSLLFNMMSRCVIVFLPKSILISWLQSPSAVILELHIWGYWYFSRQSLFQPCFIHISHDVLCV